MRWIKIAGIALLALFLLLVVAGVMRPPVWSVEVSEDVDAPISVIHSRVGNFQSWPAWSGWSQAADANAVFTLSGPARGVGASWAWKGPKIGQGRLIVTRDEPLKGLWLDEAIGSDEVNANGSITYEELGGGKTRVTWREQGRLPPVVGGLASGLLSSRLSAHFSAGLARLKALVEADQRTRKDLPETVIRGSLKRSANSERVQVAAVAGRAVFGVGLMADGQGQVTLLGKRAWFARAQEDEVIYRARVEPAGEAAWLATAKVSSWRASVITDAVDLPALEQRISARASHLNLPRQKLIPFRLTGRVVDATWHVDRGLKAAPDGGTPVVSAPVTRSQKEAITAEIVGFYAGKEARDANLGSSLHAHIMLPKMKVSGHLDSVMIQGRAILLLPDTLP